ncbi:sugar-phosphate isomerase, RpiB/LacA/LacB family [Hydrogenobacter thermophilus TK-6]|uniref:Ribose 5-phosphate isomerase B n=1 Tax=Hydrogenobacter thermophilus (strain DSM 6534 / IAM 12695 / TK-6) TaxID=608538 RepID=D3DHM6_HYDTT|nr:ribose 5-phosphate isomerase B [Hydrogenobacter thermophilus]ADO45265.1 sugar-phosphate isomerase, RpiB/LacA/LacB family [Hydrogenobacter thermophilus TK-6]BAI69328.1 ribose 5-phosphate isomerase B [Hydrogenobacter thermophilus TK-6]
MKIAIGSDHAGYLLKEKIKDFLLSKGCQVVDVGTNSTASTDYPIFAREVALAVQRGEVQQGILICGTGIGMCITANKFKGVYAALCTNEYMAKVSRQHNNANILCLGGRVLGDALAISIVEAWLSADFEGGRHERRVSLIKSMEEDSKP